jgi:hypothetical protein
MTHDRKQKQFSVVWYFITRYYMALTQKQLTFYNTNHTLKLEFCYILHHHQNSSILA